VIRPTARVLRLRPGVAVLPMGNALQLRAGDEQVHVVDCEPPELAARVLALLDGTRDRAALAAHLRSLDEPPENLATAEHLIDELDRRGWLLAPIEPPATEHDAYLARFASARADPARALRGARVRVRGHEPSAALLASLLEAHGMRASRDGDAVGLAVCVVDAPDLALLQDANDAACAARESCLFVDLSHGTHATVGPFFVPGEGACYACFRSRLRENTAAYAELVSAEQRMLATRRPLPGAGHLPAHRHIVLGVAAAELVAYVTRHRALRTLDRALTLDLEGLRVWSEPVLRVPWCAACGAPAAPRGGE
jgi:bacteriocin biosynthesis cyclodehydratase domain-containing protein